MGIKRPALLSLEFASMFHFFIVHVVDGGWTDFSRYSNCSVSCNGGNQSRWRKCTNPTPMHDGMNCSGTNIDTRQCNIYPCIKEVRVIDNLNINCIDEYEVPR